MFKSPPNPPFSKGEMPVVARFAPNGLSGMKLVSSCFHVHHVGEIAIQQIPPCFSLCPLCLCGELLF